MTDHGGAASPRTLPEPAATIVRLTEKLQEDLAFAAPEMRGLMIERRLADAYSAGAAAQEAPAPEGLDERVSTILDNARVAVVDALRAEARPPEGLDTAWAAAEAALPEGWVIECGDNPPNPERTYWAQAIGPEIDGRHPVIGFVFGSTLVAVLNDLAARLSAGGATKP